MDQTKTRGVNRFRKTPRKPCGIASDRSSPVGSPTPNSILNMSPLWDFNNLGPYFNSLSMKDGGSGGGGGGGHSSFSHLYGSTPSTPLSDLMSLGSFSNYPNAFMPLSRSRTSSFLLSDATSDSSRRGSQDYPPPATRSFSSAAVERPSKHMSELNGYEFTQDGKPKLSRSTSSMSGSKPALKATQSLLPNWALDTNGHVRARLPLAKVLDSGDLGRFAVDKGGCQYLQDAVKKNMTHYQKYQLFDQVIGRRDDFIRYSMNIFGNFLVQQVIELSIQCQDEDFLKRQERLKEFIAYGMTELCLDKSACRVVQFALENMDMTLACSLVQSLPRDARLIAICVDQNANHVIQKVVAVIPLKQWEFIVDFIAQPEHLRQICSDKYGCRVVQTIVEKLTTDSRSGDLTIIAQNQRARALQRLMQSVTNRCQELATNEYANYIIQHIVSNDDLAVYREIIIEKCLMRNLLSLSQEKFASHVVEKAFLKAPLDLLAEMMDEIFDGYVPHPDTGKDALDIMMFHQFGNYVVQCMLTICCDAVSGRRETKQGGYDHMTSFHEWLKKLHSRITKERHRLSRFSSGKKMIETLANLRITHPYLSFNSAALHSFKFEGCSSEEDNEKFGIEEDRMMLKPRAYTSPGSRGHDGDDEAGGFSP